MSEHRSDDKHGDAKENLARIFFECARYERPSLDWIEALNVYTDTVMRSAEGAIYTKADMEAACEIVRAGWRTKPVIAKLVDRFLSWRLPNSVCADPCATEQGYPDRLGTNLLTADEARLMLLHVLALDREAAPMGGQEDDAVSDVLKAADELTFALGHVNLGGHFARLAMVLDEKVEKAKAARSPEGERNEGWRNQAEEAERYEAGASEARSNERRFKSVDDLGPCECGRVSESGCAPGGRREDCALTARSSVAPREPGMAPGAELLVETDRNARYWLNAARAETHRDVALHNAEQAINAWRNAAYAMAARAIQEAEKASATPSAKTPLKPEDVEWVVNDNAELGVKIGDQFFFLYKAHSLVYETGLHDDGKLMHWRPVFKREFGECCHPVNYAEPSKWGTVDLDDSDQWKPLPAAMDSTGGQGG